MNRNVFAALFALCLASPAAAPVVAKTGMEPMTSQQK